MTTTFQQAIEAIKKGDKKTGKELLTEVLRANARNEAAWLWMAHVVDSNVQRRECLARVLTINPNNESAWRGLTQLNRPAPPPVPPSVTPPPVDTIPATVEPVLSLPPAESDDSSPPAATKAGRSDRFWCGWILLFLVATAAIFIGIELPRRWTMWSRFAQSGVTTYATVVETQIGEIDGRPYVTYKFELPQLPEGFKQYSKKEQVAPSFYRLLKPGMLIKVQYLFDRPSNVRIQGSENFHNLVFWSLLGLATAIAAGLPVLVGAGSALSQGWRTLTGLPKLFKKKPAKPEVVWEGEGPPPLKQWTGTYTFGQDSYEGFFIIETEEGTFLGEGGMEIYKAVPETEPKQVIAFDVGLFDKTDITTLSRVVMSEYAYQEESVLTALEANPHAEAILAKPGAAFTMESKAMRVEARIEEVAYANGDNVYFDKLTVGLDIFVKEGVDLDQPMEIPDQFKEET